jgi:hypothetical protein
MSNEELTQWDAEYLGRFTNENAGLLVETKSGVTGRTYNKEGLVNGKVRVHGVNGEKLLCSLKNLTLKGYID